jgi:hypothetical protein
VAQDEALSRLKPGFEFPWGHFHKSHSLCEVTLIFWRNMKSLSQSSRGFIIALVATVLWSTTGPLISYLSTTYSLPSLVLAFWRDLSVSFGMLVGLLIFSRARFFLERTHWGFIALYGLTLAIFNSLWTFSVQYNGGGCCHRIGIFLARNDCSLKPHHFQRDI